MSRKKRKTVGAADRRQAEIQRLMKHAADKAERRLQAETKDAAHEEPVTAIPEPAQERTERKLPRSRARGHAYVERTVPTRVLSLGLEADDGGIKRYAVRFPSGTDLGKLMKAIRTDGYSATESVQVSDGTDETGMEYKMHAGIYIRADAPAGRKQRKTAKWLADLIDRPITAVRAMETRDGIDWFVEIAPDQDDETK